MSRTVPTTATTPASPVHEGDAPVALSRATVGCRWVIQVVEGPDRAELEREGVLPGSVVVVAARTPLGGPVVVELGRARLALSAKVAAQVLVGPCTDSDDVA